MSRYCFECPVCGEQKEVSRPMRDSSVPELCGCGRRMVRDYQAEHSAVRGDFDEPIVSESLAFDSRDVAEHRKRFPGVDLVVEGDTARPILRSQTQRRKYIKGRGWIDVNSFV